MADAHTSSARTKSLLDIVHELGHQIGMVPDGSGKLPDRTVSFYDNPKGHVGTTASMVFLRTNPVTTRPTMLTALNASCMV